MKIEGLRLENYMDLQALKNHALNEKEMRSAINRLKVVVDCVTLQNLLAEGRK